MPSPVAQYALDRGFPSDLIFTPNRAGEDFFLSNLRSLQPELCITAAYGNILPTKFLNIPAQGTVNIHPSLLPLYRGAAPIQRALQDGMKETGVSLAFTVRALDAGPVIAYERYEVDDEIKAPELLNLLFDLGSKILVRQLPSILDGSAKSKAQPQDESKATLAPKVRAFAGWPGTRARVRIVDPKDGAENILELKVITTKVSRARNSQDSKADDVTFRNAALIFPCAGTAELEVHEVQLPGKKVIPAAAFWNGLRGQKLKKL